MKNLVESDTVGWINISNQPFYKDAINYLVGWNYYVNTDTVEELILKKVLVERKLHSDCGFHSSESLLCVRIINSNDSFEKVSSILHSYYNKNDIITDFVVQIIINIFSISPVNFLW